MEITVHSTDETKKLAEQLAAQLKPGSVVALTGELGSGKTTFVSFLVKALRIEARVQSPTFVILRKYIGAELNVNHFDLYRLIDYNDVEDLGFEEIINEPKSITLIEWPELVADHLPPETIKISFEVTSENERKINVSNLS